MPGMPTNRATKRLAGSRQISSGVPTWTIDPARITAIRSPRVSASVWSCVT